MLQPDLPTKFFVIYAREDNTSIVEFKKSLAPLERKGEIQVWYDGEIAPGQEWEKAIKSNLKTADIIVLLLSRDFFDSDYIHTHELQEALERHDEGDAIVVPILLRHCGWELVPEIKRLQVLPDNAVPVYSKKHWDDLDEAFTNVTNGIVRLLKTLKEKKTAAAPKPVAAATHAPAPDRAKEDAQAIAAELQLAAEEYDKENYAAAFSIFFRHQNSPLFLGEYQRRLGRMYHFGHFVSVDYSKAKTWYEKAVENGDAGAMNNIGVLYNNGEGVAQDYHIAKEWYKKAADKGNALAMRNLGLLYDNDEGVAQDYQKAREWYEKAAEKGDATAMNNLGILYDNGEGVAQDHHKARDWYEKAVKKGNVLAMTNLGVLYNNGQGVTQDYHKAREWFEKAAEKGETTAMRNLGKLYQHGRGVTQSYQQATTWYIKARDLGDEESGKRLKEMLSNK